MSTSNISLTAQANNVTQSMILCIKIWSYCLFIFGMIGHTLNIYVFTRPKFRKNPCVLYLLAATIFGYGTASFVTLIRMLQISYRIDIFAYSSLSCQIVSYIFATNK